MNSTSTLWYTHPALLTSHAVFIGKRLWCICMISYMHILGTQSVVEVSTTDEATTAIQL